MDAKYQKYYDKLKGVNLSSSVTPIISGCSSLKTNTTKLGTQVSESTWKELGLDQVKTAVIPAFEQSVDTLKGNCDVLQGVCTDIEGLVSILERLESACKSYDSCPNDEEHASERSSLRQQISNIEKEADAKIAAIKAKNGSVKDVNIKLQGQSTDINNANPDLSNLDTGSGDLNTQGTTGTNAKGNFVYYCQGDFKQSYGGGKTIAQAGCGPTSLAMVLTYYTGKKITPVDTANYAMKKGYRIINNGTSDNLFPAMCKEYGINGEFQKPSSNNIVTALKQGKTIIAHMGPGTFTKGGHYIVLKGITSDGRVLVADPNHRNYNNKTFSADLIAKESKARMYVVG